MMGEVVTLWRRLMTETAQPGRRVRKRLWIPIATLALGTLAALGVYIRATRVDDAERNPATASDGTVTQLLRDEAGVSVRCARVVEKPPEAVWAVVRDYPSHPKFLPYLRSLDVALADDGTVRLDGVAHSAIWGDWPFVSRVKLAADAERHTYRATWDEAGGPLARNRGGWTVRPHGDGQALLVFALQVEVAKAPDWIVRTVLMDRLHQVVNAMAAEATTRRAP